VSTSGPTLSDGSAGAGGKLSRSDIEDKFRQLQGDLSTAAEGARSKLVVAGGAAAVLLLVVVFLLGRRGGKKKSTIVEIRRL
jgi:hypothetical protein